jgi:hypothetical protein
MSTDEIVLFFSVFGFFWGYATCAFRNALSKDTEVKNYRPYDWAIDGE